MIFPAIRISPSDPSQAQGESLAGRVIFGLATLALLLFGVFIISRPVLWLLGVVGDDAFYYLLTARHLAASGVSTFDGIHLTNGYHPGWMLLMTLCAKLFPGRDALLRACLAVSFLFQFVTGLLLTAAIRRCVSSFWAWTAGAFWLVGPLSLYLSMEGVEASLYSCALALVLLTYLTRIAPHVRPEAPFNPPARDLAWFGVSLGIAFLARTEAVILALTAFAFLALVIRYRTETTSSGRSYGRVLIFAGLPFLALALCWPLYSLLAVHTVTQRSGAMKMLWGAHYNAGLFRHLWSLEDFWRRMWVGRGQLFLGGTQLNSYWILPLELIELILPVLFFRRAWRDPEARPLVDLSLWLLSFLTATGLFYGLFLTDIQIWYEIAPCLILFFLTLVWGFWLVSNSARRQDLGSARFQAAVCLLPLALSLHFLLRPSISYPWQRDVYVSQPKFEAMIPPQARIGCFNAGIPAYFSDRTVVNLDGLVNNSVYPYWKSHTFDRYLPDQHIDYVIDETDAIARGQDFSSAHLPLVPLASAPLRGWMHPTRWLWRVEVGQASGKTLQLRNDLSPGRAASDNEATRGLRGSSPNRRAALSTK